MKLDIEKLDEDKLRNFQERLSFIGSWVECVRKYSDEKWSSNQKGLIDSEVINARRFYKELAKISEGREKMKGLREMQIRK